MTKKLSFPKIFFWVGIISLLLVYVILWAQMIKTPSERTGTDFIAFYTAGRVAQEYGAQEVYNIAYQKSIQEGVLGFSITKEQQLIYIHPPLIIPLLVLIVQENYSVSFFVWVFMQTVLYGISFYVLSHIQPKTWSSEQKLNFSLSGILFFPNFISLLLGQDTSFVFLGVSIFIYGTLSKKDFLSGIGLALTTMRPHISLALALPLLVKNRKAFKYFVASGTLLALFSIWMLGIKGTENFIQILMISGKGADYGTKEFAMYNFIGFLTRTFPLLETNTIHIIGWSAYFLSIVMISAFWNYTNEKKTYCLSLAVISSLFFAPHLHYHDLSLLIIPIFLLLISRQIPLPKKTLAFIPLAISFILIFTRSIPLMNYSLPYLLTVSLLFFAQNNKELTSL